MGRIREVLLQYVLYPYIDMGTYTCLLAKEQRQEFQGVPFPNHEDDKSSLFSRTANSTAITHSQSAGSSKIAQSWIGPVMMQSIAFAPGYEKGGFIDPFILLRRSWIRGGNDPCRLPDSSLRLERPCLSTVGMQSLEGL